MSVTHETPAVVDPTEARLKCIRIAFEGKFKLDQNTPDWLAKGVAEIKAGEEVDATWLVEIDKENSYV